MISRVILAYEEYVSRHQLTFFTICAEAPGAVLKRRFNWLAHQHTRHQSRQVLSGATNRSFGKLKNQHGRPFIFSHQNRLQFTELRYLNKQLPTPRSGNLWHMSVETLAWINSEPLEGHIHHDQSANVATSFHKKISTWSEDNCPEMHNSNTR